jgi:ribose transport system substrate-binding protein
MTVRRSLLLAGATVLTLACNRGKEAGTSARPTVALVVKTMNNPFFIEMERGARAAADSLGVDLVVQAPEREIDVEKQMQIVENLIQRHVDVLAISPNGSREIVPAILEANRAGIPVLAVDTRIDAATLQRAGGKVVSFIGSDNVDGGRLAGEFLAAQLGGKGAVAVIEGIPGHETGDSRLRGFRDALAKFPGITIVSSQTANWERDQAFNVMQNTLQSHPDIRGVFACNDVMVLGAVEAIAAAKHAGPITVVGFDAQDDAKQAIRDGKLHATIAQSPAEMGRRAVESAYRILHKEAVPAEQPVKIALVTRETLGVPSAPR